MSLARVPALRAGEQHLAAGESRHRRERAHDEPVVRQGQRVRVEPHHCRRRRARRDLPPHQRRHAREVLRRAVMEPHLVPRAQRPGAGQDRHPGVEAAPGQAGDLGRRHPAAPGDVVAVQPAEVHAHAAPRLHHLGLVVVHLHAAHRGARAAGHDDQAVAGLDLARPQRAGDHRADALEREHAVHGQARRACVAARLRAVRGTLERGQQVLQAAAVPCAHGHQLAAGERRALEEPGHVLLGQLEQLLVHQVGLGQRHHAVAHAQQLDDGQVLAGLRHHAVVGGDDQQEEVHPGGAGDHGAHEALVARHVDDAQPGPRRELQLGVAELDGDAALALLAQPVGVLAGEPRDERRLAVVDVAGGAERERGETSRLRRRILRRPGHAVRPAR